MSVGGFTFLGVLKLLSLDICWARLSHPVTAGIMTYGLSRMLRKLRVR